MNVFDRCYRVTNLVLFYTVSHFIYIRGFFVKAPFFFMHTKSDKSFSPPNEQIMRTVLTFLIDSWR